MADFPIEQAIYHRQGDAAPILVAGSPGFSEAWQPAVVELLTGFGERPAGVSCPSAVFAHPLGKDQVTVVHVADQNGDGSTAPGLGYHVLVLPRQAYARFLGDPFLLSERLPPDWTARGSMPALSWPAAPLPRRTVAQVQEVLKRLKSKSLREDEEVPQDSSEPERTAENSEGPALLGGVQVLIDGGRLVFERPAPDTRLLRGLWTLLPTSTRSQLWPASFAFSNALHFDAVVVRRARAAEFPGYTTEDQAADYPEGRYELRLQTAAEAGDQGELDALLGRRSWAETWRLGLTVLGLLLLLLLAGRFLEMPPRPPPSPAHERQAAIVVGVVGIGHPLGTAAAYVAARDTLIELEHRAGPEP
jgi:hypothetical protein